MQTKLAFAILYHIYPQLNNLLCSLYFIIDPDGYWIEIVPVK